MTSVALIHRVRKLGSKRTNGKPRRKSPPSTPPIVRATQVLGDLLRRGFEREIPGYELPTDGDLWAFVLWKGLPRCQHHTMLVPMTNGVFLKEYLLHGGYRLTYRGELYCPFCAANHLRLLRGRLLSWWRDAKPSVPLYLQLGVQNLDRLKKARERAGWPLYRWFRSQGLTAFTSAPLGKAWTDIPIDPDSLEGVLDAVLLGIELNVPTLKDDLLRFRNRPTDGSRVWSKESYVEKNYRGGEEPGAIGKPVFLGATLDQVLEAARKSGVYFERHSTELDDGTSTGRSAFAPNARLSEWLARAGLGENPAK